MDTVIRVLVIYVVLLAALRVIGKREFGQLSPFEFVTLLLIPELVSQALVREDFSLTNSLIAVSTLLSLVFLTSLLTHKSQRLNNVIAGVPTVLVDHGQFVLSNMDKERVSPDEIYHELHKVGLTEIKEVRWVILEADGKLSIIPMKDEPDQQHFNENRENLEAA